jgi:hypothetical protein
MKNIAWLEEKKALAGLIDVPIKILNELDTHESEREALEAQIIEWQQRKDDLTT